MNTTFYLIVAICVLAIFSALLYEYEKVEAVSAQKEVSDIKAEAAQQTVKAKQRNQAAQQQQEKDQQDFSKKAIPLEVKIANIKNPTVLNDEEKSVAADLCRLHNCGGLFVVQEGCSGSAADSGVLPDPGKATVPDPARDGKGLAPSEAK